MRIDEKIKQIVDSLGGLTFEFNDWTKLNYKLSQKNLPVCMYLLPVSGSFLNKNNNMRDRPKALIAFLVLSELDFEGETNEPTVERMKQYAKRFIAAVNKSGMFKPISEITHYSVVYDKLDDNVTGVVIDIELEELIGDCVSDYKLKIENEKNRNCAR
jgi:hypothetical protein